MGNGALTPTWNCALFQPKDVSADRPPAPTKTLTGNFPAACGLAVVVYLLGDRARPLIPACSWFVFFALLHEPTESFSSRGLIRFFTHLWPSTSAKFPTAST